MATRAAAKKVHHIKRIDNNWTTCAMDARSRNQPTWTILVSTTWDRVTCKACLRQEPLHQNITEPRP